MTKLKFAIPVLALLAMLACTTTQKTTAYNTLYSTEGAVLSSYNAYLDLVVAGKVPTNDVPKVSVAFNRFQAGMQTAIVAAQLNWTNLAPNDVIGLANDVLNAITKAKGSK